MPWWNPFKPKPTQPINEQVQPSRAIALKKLQESVGTQPDLFAALMDRYFSDGEWWQPISGIPMFGGTSNREHGKDTYGGFYTEQDLRFQRDAARLLYAREPIAKAIEAHMSAFVIGKGMSYKVCAKKDFTDEYSTPEAQKRLAQYQQYFDTWMDEQQWPEREQECYACKLVDGEFFLWVKVSKGKVTVRRLEPEHIQNKPGTSYQDGWFLGVKYDLKDVETPIAYGYKPDYVPWQEIPADQIIHYKANVTRNVARGISDFYPITDDLNGIATLSDNLRQGASARAGVAYIASVKNATPAAITGFADDMADRTTTNAITGRQDRSKSIKPGAVQVHSDNTEITTMPQGDVAGSVTALQAALRIIGNRFSMPEYMISGDASNANYASTQMAGTPFVRKVEIEQNLLKRPFKEIMMMVMRQAVVSLVIPSSELAKLDIEIECGSPVIEDEYQQAQMYDIMRRNGVISPQKWCMAKGLEYEEVQRDINEWNEANMAAPGLGGSAAASLHQLQLSRRDQQTDGGADKQDQQEEDDPTPVKENVVDASGHMHKGKGVEGGQFTGKGDAENHIKSIGRKITKDEAIEKVKGKTEKPGGVDPTIHFTSTTGDHEHYEVDLPLDMIADNQNGDLYDSTTKPDIAASYASRDAKETPPIIAAVQRKGGKLFVVDGGHRVSAARMRGDKTIKAIVPVKEKP